MVSKMTLPPISDHKIHRYDLVKEQMMLPGPADAVQPVLERMAGSLKAGHRVWIVGVAMFLRPGETPLVVRHGRDRSSEADYNVAWSQHVGQFIHRHATRVDVVAVPVGGPLGNYENASLFRVEGWRGD